MKPVQIGSNWFILDQKSSRWIKLIIWFKSDKIGPKKSNPIKLDQIGSNVQACFFNSSLFYRGHILDFFLSCRKILENNLKTNIYFVEPSFIE